MNLGASSSSNLLRSQGPLPYYRWILVHFPTPRPLRSTRPFTHPLCARPLHSGKFSPISFGLSPRALARRPVTRIPRLSPRPAQPARPPAPGSRPTTNPLSASPLSGAFAHGAHFSPAPHLHRLGASIPSPTHPQPDSEPDRNLTAIMAIASSGQGPTPLGPLRSWPTLGAPPGPSLRSHGSRTRCSTRSRPHAR